VEKKIQWCKKYYFILKKYNEFHKNTMYFTKIQVISIIINKIALKIQRISQNFKTSKKPLKKPAKTFKFS
jgi:hypothetical protein